MLTLCQELPDAFESAALKRHVVCSRGNPPFETRGKLLHMPGASSQGGRRIFVLAQTSDDRIELRLQLPSGEKCWELVGPLPKKQKQTIRAREISSPTASIIEDDKTRVGTFELIEGSMAKGYLDLFLANADFEGEWLLAADPQASGEWTIHRPTVDESGLTFEMPSPETATRVGPTMNVWSRPQGPSRGLVIPWKSDSPIPIGNLPEAKPAFSVPMECRLSEVPGGTSWLYEVKLDGYRAIAIQDHKPALLSRYGRSFGHRFPGILSALETMKLPACVLDGEVVALDPQGRPNFQELQNRRSTRQPIVYYVFDILNYGGRDLRRLPLVDRRKVLDWVAEKFVEPV